MLELISHVVKISARRDRTEINSAMVDALLDLSRLNIEPVSSPSADPALPDQVKWEIRRKAGWLVPLPIGYAGISPLYVPGDVENARDGTTTFRFVESLYSLGQWISPHRLDSLQQLLWTQESDAANGIYRCTNRYSDTLAAPITQSKEQHHG